MVAEYYLGVDLGTTFTAAAAARNGHVEMLRLGGAETVIPSMVFLREDGSISTGPVAEQQGESQPARLARGAEFKRRFGAEVPLQLGSTSVSAHVVFAWLLRWVVEHVTRQEGGPPTRVAITHPANWGRFKLDFLDQAVTQAGVGDALMLSEPEAAAIHYAALEKVEPGDLVAVYDLGGGTFDAAVLARTAGGYEVMGQPQGVEKLGGIDFDDSLFRFVAGHLDGAIADLDLADPAVAAALRHMREGCVKAKHALSAVPDATVSVLLPNAHKQVRVSRADFEQAIRPTVNETVIALERALASAGVSADDLSRVLLVGGSSRIPLVAQMVEAALGIQVAVDTDPKNAIAKGAARVARDPAPSPEPPQPRRGDDVEAALAVTFEEAFLGAAKRVEWDGESRRVDVPAGVADGQVLRIDGAGAAGVDGGPAGDLLVRIAVGEHPAWGRDGDDLLTERRLSREEAGAGASVAVATPGGDVQVAVPAGSVSGDVVRVAGHGFPRPGTGERGDLVVTLEVAAPPAREPRRGEDVEATLAVTFEEAFLGTARLVEIDGEARRVEVPAGVAHGERVRVDGAGRAGTDGGPAGDLVVVVNVGGHPVLGREGDDLLAERRVSHEEAHDGATITVATPGGDVAVEVPAGTVSGDVVRVPGQGFPRPGTDQRGDLVVTIEVAAAERPTPGRDIEVQVPLTLEQAFQGVTKRLTTERGAFDADIPAGVADGEQLRFAGQGGVGSGGGPAGDVIATFSVADHPSYGREGDHLLIAHTLGPEEAAKGVAVSITTPDGEHRLDVPPGTTDGSEVRLTGAGFPRPGSDLRGDAVVTIRVAESRRLETLAITLGVVLLVVGLWLPWYHRDRRNALEFGLFAWAGPVLAIGGALWLLWTRRRGKAHLGVPRPALAALLTGIFFVANALQIAPRQALSSAIDIGLFAALAGFAAIGLAIAVAWRGVRPRSREQGVLGTRWRPARLATLAAIPALVLSLYLPWFSDRLPTFALNSFPGDMIPRGFDAFELRAWPGPVLVVVGAALIVAVAARRRDGPVAVKLAAAGLVVVGAVLIGVRYAEGGLWSVGSVLAVCATAVALAGVGDLIGGQAPAGASPVAPAGRRRLRRGLALAIAVVGASILLPGWFGGNALQFQDFRGSWGRAWTIGPVVVAVGAAGVLLLTRRAKPNLGVARLSFVTALAGVILFLRSTAYGFAVRSPADGWAVLVAFVAIVGAALGSYAELRLSAPSRGPQTVRGLAWLLDRGVLLAGVVAVAASLFLPWFGSTRAHEIGLGTWLGHAVAIAGGVALLLMTVRSPRVPAAYRRVFAAVALTGASFVAVAAIFAIGREVGPVVALFGAAAIVAGTIECLYPTHRSEPAVAASEA